LQFAVLNDPGGRGGSAYIHEHATPDMPVGIRGPKNHFRLDEGSDHYLLIAGGIGITPIISMADRLKKIGRRYEIHYAGRSLADMAFVNRLKKEHGNSLKIYSSQEDQRIDVKACLKGVGPSSKVYACGPERLLSHLQELAKDWPVGIVHVEHFSGLGSQLDPKNEISFDVELKDSGLTLSVPPNKTVLQVLREAGVDVQSDCEEGLCGTCEVALIEGDVDHRDKVLTESERLENCRLMTCCSRARSGKVVLAL
ncbi:MAG: PDR/VanB family oxidoreductase, partial [Afipia sp.]|nr:PDR/VanB family oxidoreductase [Afipia sp.]